MCDVARPASAPEWGPRGAVSDCERRPEIRVSSNSPGLSTASYRRYCEAIVGPSSRLVLQDARRRPGTSSFPFGLRVSVNVLWQYEALLRQPDVDRHRSAGFRAGDTQFRALSGRGEGRLRWEFPLSFNATT